MQYRPPTGSIPDAPGSYQFYDAEGRVLYVGKAKSLRHRLPNYWQDSGQAPAPHGPDGGPGRPRRVGGGRQRGRRADPGALADSGAPAPLQRAPQGRQELPLAGRHAERGVAPPGRGAGAQAQGRPLLRPLRQRRGHPVDPRPAGAELPGAHVLGHQVHAARAAGPALPALRHRPLLGAVRRRGRPRGLRRLRQRPHAVPLGRHRAGAGEPGGGDAGRRRTSCSSSGRHACATGSRPSTRRPRPSRWSPTGPRTSTWSAWPRTRSRRRCRSSGCAGAAWSGTGASWPRRSRTSRAPSSWRSVVSQVYGGGRGGGAPSGAGARGAGRPRAPAELAARRARRPGRHRRAAPRAPSGPCRRR